MSALSRRTSLVGAVAVCLAGAIGFETRAYFLDRSELARLARETAVTRTRAVRTRAELREAEQRTKAAREEVERMAPAMVTVDAELQQAGEAWRARVERLKQIARERPKLGVPELQILAEEEWFGVTKESMLETEAGITAAFEKLQERAHWMLSAALNEAVERYATEHEGMLPRTTDQLAPFLRRPIPDELLGRYDVLRQGKLSDVGKDDWLLAERAHLAEAAGRQVYVTRSDAGVEDLTTVSDRVLTRALRGYVDAHQGALPVAPVDLVPHFAHPPGTTALETFLARPRSDFTPARLNALLKPN